MLKKTFEIKKISFLDYQELKERAKTLRRLIKSHTVYGWFDNPTKTPEEIEAIKNVWKAELTYINLSIATFEDACIGEYLVQIDAICER